MRRCKLSRFIGALAIALISTAGLYGLSGMTPANAGIWPNLTNELCMADAYLKKPGNSLPQDALNCTANDVEITQVIPLDANGKRPGDAGYEPVECSDGQSFTLHADVTVKTNANERYDTTFYLPLGAFSPQHVQPSTNKCSLILPKPDDEAGQAADVNLDNDQCGDITKANGTDTYTLYDETITMFCKPSADDPKKAEFTYCAAWDNILRNNCGPTAGTWPAGTTYTPGQIPNTKSKCNCDAFPIDVFIKPTPPTISKTLVGTNTHTEPGGEYTFNISFTNPSNNASLFVSSLTDNVDDLADGSYETTLDLWGSLTTIDAFTPDGVYLTASNCLKPVSPATSVEVAPSGVYSCQIKVYIVDRALEPAVGVNSKELYDDVIKAALKDKNGDPVVDGDTCPTGVTHTTGDHCSPFKEVQVTNVSPAITVDKTADPTEVVETTTGHLITYTVKITNTSTVDPVTITAIKDSVDGGTAVDLAGDSDCQVGTTLAVGDWCDFTYQTNVTGNTGDAIKNKVTAYVEDNEKDTANNYDEAMVTFTNSPGSIKLTKTPDGQHVTESGGNVDFHFVIENTSAIDSITLTEMSDDKLGVLFDSSSHQGNCDFYGDVLAPGDTRECTVTKFMSGEPGVDHINWATVYGNTGDYIPCTPPQTGDCLETVMAKDDGKVIFDDEPADINLAVDMSLTLFVTITNNSSYESVFLDKLQIAGLDVTDNAGTASLVIRNTGGSFGGTSFGACAEDLGTTPYEIAKSASYKCAFTVELKNSSAGAGNLFSILSGGGDLAVAVHDNDGNPSVEKSVNVKAQLVPNL